MEHSEGIRKLRAALEEQWADCRWGLIMCDENPAARARLLEWMKLSNHWADALWAKIILSEDTKGRDFALQTPEYPHDDNSGHWRQMASSAPFPILRRFIEEESCE